MTIHFIVTGSAKAMAVAKAILVAYTPLHLDLLKEGKGVVAQGKLGTDGQFVAAEGLARHDENYMPAEARHVVDQAGKTAKTLKQ